MYDIEYSVSDMSDEHWMRRFPHFTPQVVKIDKIATKTISKYEI